MHTTASDGTDTPAEMLARVQKAGITTFAVSDHDTIQGAMAMKELVPEGMTYIPGIEFSTITPVRQAHILGYDYDEKDPVFLSAIEHGLALRRTKLERRLVYLKDTFDIVFPEDVVEHFRLMESCGKPHLGAELMIMGYGNTLSEAIETYLAGAPDENDRITSKEAIDAIHHAGGVVIWAHPLGGENVERFTPERFEAQLSFLVDEGIDGLECWYGRYDESDVAFLLKAAKQHHLYVSGGSDDHGTRKSVHLGQLNTFGRDVNESDITWLESRV